MNEFVIGKIKYRWRCTRKNTNQKKEFGETHTYEKVESEQKYRKQRNSENAKTHQQPRTATADLKLKQQQSKINLEKV